MTQHKNKKSHGRRRTMMLLAFAALPTLLVAFPGKASESDAPEFRLYVRPSICVSYDSEAPCTMSMEVRWEGEVDADVCLRDALAQPVLHCWQDSNGGSVEIDYANTVDTRYQLIEEGTQGVLAEAEIKVINRDLRDSRKRRRHVWSIL